MSDDTTQEQQPSDTPLDKDTIRARLAEAYRTIYDPEIPINIYDLGLIYEIRIDDDMKVEVVMTLTSPSCPVAGQLVNEVNFKSWTVREVRDVKVTLTWDPPWSKEKATEAAREELEMMFGI